MIFDLRKRTNQYISNKLQLVKLKSGYLEGTIGMLHGEAQAELRTEFNMNYCGGRVTKDDRE